MLNLNSDELEYIIKLIQEDKKYFPNDEYKNSLLHALYDEHRYKIDPNLSSTEKFLLYMEMNPIVDLECTNVIGKYKFRRLCVDHLSSEIKTITAYEIRIDGYINSHTYTVSPSFNIDEFLNEIEWDDVRICDICGKPMTKGYTNEELYICSDIEFVNFMNDNYLGSEYVSWIPINSGEEDLYNGMYKACNSNGEWVDTYWYYTEWIWTLEFL